MTNSADKPLVVITGSSGLIGSRLAEKLRPDFRLAGLDIKFPPGEQEGLARIECDLTDQHNVRAALGEVRERFGGEIESVIHLAAYYDFSGEPSPLYRKLTVEGTRRLLEELKSFRVHQFVFSSTLLVMDPADQEERLTPASPVEAEWDYPKSKLETEKVIRQAGWAMPRVILRIAGVYNEDCHTVPIAQQIRRIYEKQLESYFFPGDKHHGQSFVHLDDLVDCFRKVIERREQLSPLEVFLIGEEDVMSYEELQERIGQLVHGSAWPSIRIPKPAAKAGAWVKEQLARAGAQDPFIKPWMVDLADQNYPVSIAKSREILGWQPRHSLRATLPEIIDRLCRDPHAWYETNGLPLPDRFPECAGRGAGEQPGRKEVQEQQTTE